MNRRDALKSLLAAPVAAAVVPMAVEPESFDLSQFVGNIQPDLFMETISGLRDAGPLTVNLQWLPSVETVWIRGLPLPGGDGCRVWLDAAHDVPMLGAKTIEAVQPDQTIVVFTDTGERDANGRRIFA
jgi:hypothetical protein